MFFGIIYFSDIVFYLERNLLVPNVIQGKDLHAL